ncbi:MAG: hypothetical protein KIS88_06265 [Anaerolineales bacterium]|nr:hypothetical protein [Anaerolineales bacterium]
MENSAIRVLAISTDLFFMPQVEAAAKAAGYSFEWLDAPLSPEAFASQLAAAPTALVVLDLGTRLPWQEWLPAAKAHAAVSDIRWLAFGPHTDAKLLVAARKAGVAKAVARSQFAETLRTMLSSSDVHPERSEGSSLAHG